MMELRASTAVGSNGAAGQSSKAFHCQTNSISSVGLAWLHKNNFEWSTPNKMHKHRVSEWVWECHLYLYCVLCSISVIWFWCQPGGLLWCSAHTLSSVTIGRFNARLRIVGSTMTTASHKAANEIFLNTIKTLRSNAHKRNLALCAARRKFNLPVLRFKIVWSNYIPPCTHKRAKQ